MGPVPGWFVAGVVLVMILVFVGAFLVAQLARAPLGELQSRPRRRRLAMSDLFFRPYVVPPPRRRASRTGKTGSQPPH